MNDTSAMRNNDSPGDDLQQSRYLTFRPRHGDPRSVYIHVPFCRHRCGYCNFTLVAGRDYLIERFLSSLQTEISWLERSYEIDSLFLGGGTPSHLSPKQLDRLGQIILSRFNLNPTAEVTAECNPNDLDDARMAALTGLGVNRISLGVQSLDPDKLKRLERSHSIDDIRHAIELARSQSSLVSMDLIFAAPGETLSAWETDLETAIALKPDHMSTYELTYEKGTRFWNNLNQGKLSPSDEDLRGEMYTLAIATLSENGLPQYEVSSFAKPANQCRHNLGYWNGDPFFAFGPGAARFIDGIREINHQSTMRYLKLIEEGSSPVADRELLDREAAARERLVIGLRRIAGVQGKDFHQRTGKSVSVLLGKLEHEWIENGLLIRGDDFWRLTPRGIMIFDWIAGEILGGD